MTVIETPSLDDGRRVVRKGELAALVDLEAGLLDDLGVQRVATLADNGCGWALADLALHRLRRLHVPLPMHFSVTQRIHVVEDAGVDTVLADSDELPRELGTLFRRLVRSPTTGLWIFRRELTHAGRPAVAEGTVKVTYTSGSTGTPRGVCLSATTIEDTADSLAQATAELRLTRHLSLMPLSVLLENIAGVHAALRTGATCLLPRTQDIGMTFGALDPGRLLASLEAWAPESLVLVPELLRLLVGAVQRGFHVPRTLKFVAVGGAVVSPALLGAAEAVGIPVYEGYGLSECGSVVCLNTPRAHKRGSVGRPLPHARLRVDARGEIHVAAPTLLGHLGDDRPHAGEIATGDLGRLDEDGFLYVTGRSRNVLITSLGRNVSPEWIESELLLDGAIGWAVVAGEGQPTISAWLHPSNAGIDRERLGAAVEATNRRLPPYARIGRWRELPEAPTLRNGWLTANGRIRRDALLADLGLPHDDYAQA